MKFTSITGPECRCLLSPECAPRTQCALNADKHTNSRHRLEGKRQGGCVKKTKKQNDYNSVSAANIFIVRGRNNCQSLSIAGESNLLVGRK